MILLAYNALTDFSMCVCMRVCVDGLMRSGIMRSFFSRSSADVSVGGKCS